MGLFLAILGHCMHFLLLAGMSSCIKTVFILISIPPSFHHSLPSFLPACSLLSRTPYIPTSVGIFPSYFQHREKVILMVQWCRLVHDGFVTFNKAVFYLTLCIDSRWLFSPYICKASDITLW